MNLGFGNAFSGGSAACPVLDRLKAKLAIANMQPGLLRLSCDFVYRVNVTRADKCRSMKWQ
jgi:hypothetical protein